MKNANLKRRSENGSLDAQSTADHKVKQAINQNFVASKLANNFAPHPGYQAELFLNVKAKAEVLDLSRLYWSLKDHMGHWNAKLSALGEGGSVVQRMAYEAEVDSCIDRLTEIMWAMAVSEPRSLGEAVMLSRVLADHIQDTDDDLLIMLSASLSIALEKLQPAKNGKDCSSR